MQECARDTISNNDIKQCRPQYSYLRMRWFIQTSFLMVWYSSTFLCTEPNNQRFWWQKKQTISPLTRQFWEWSMVSSFGETWQYYIQLRLFIECQHPSNCVCLYLAVEVFVNFAHQSCCYQKLSFVTNIKMCRSDLLCFSSCQPSFHVK